jgi:phosphoglycerol transferase MdoB-like AlkP superfamily enzyme
MMPFINKIPRLYLYVIAALSLFLIIQTGLRFIFWLRFNNPVDPLSSADLLWSFYLGLKFDLQVSLVALLPVLLLGWIKPLHPVYSQFGKRLWAVYISLTFILMYLIYVTDAGHYAYLQQRLNATALRFLENPFISASMVWETYPIISGGILFCLITAITIYLFLKLTGMINSSDSVRSYWRDKRWYQLTALILITIVIIFSGLMAKISWYPLRWSDAFFSTHAFSSQLTLNPVIYFSNTLKNVDESYDLEAAINSYPTMVDYLDISNPSNNPLNYKRSYTFDAADNNQTNVIVVILESFASYKSSLSKNPLDSTPHIKQLADDGYYFENFFTPTTGTARSIWAFITGIPDIELNKTSSRNPLIVDQHTIINAFKDYKKYYFLGGSASWANVRGILTSNIPDLQLYEEGSYESEVIDVWGISDLSLFREAHAILKDESQPFFSVIQTSGNHRPYTIPEDNANFKLWTEDDISGDVKNHGFASLEELNSFRFMDHSIGEFIRLAKQAAYFDNTVFVFFGDHGIHAPTGDHTPVSEAQLNLQGLRVPLVIYGKSVIQQAKVFDTIASEVDVLPTIAGLTRTSYTNSTLGRDLLDDGHKKNNYAFTIDPNEGRIIGLLSDKFYLQLKVINGNSTFHDLASSNARVDVTQQYNDTAQLYKNKLIAIWDTVRYMRENNKPE